MNSSKISVVFKNLEKAEFKNRAFLQKREETISYKQLLKEINKLHSFFQSSGLKMGDKIILSTTDDYYTSLFFLAFLRYGIVTVFLDPETQKEQSKSIILKSEAQGFVMDESLFTSRDIQANPKSFQLRIKKDAQKKGKLFNRLLKIRKTETTSSTNTFPAILDHLEERLSPIGEIPASHLAYIIFTSGTTSNPKGVLINHGNLFSHLETLSKAYNLDENVRILNILMLYHADGSIQGPLLSLYNQATWLRPLTFDLARIGDLFNAIYKYRATHFVTVPTVLSFMTKFKEDYEDSFQTDDFKFVISVASKLEDKLWEDFEHTFKTSIVNVYGLTETVAGSLFCTLNPRCNKGTVGRPIDCEAKILREDGSLAQKNEYGSLWLKGKHIFESYLNNAEASQQMLVDGWLNTGDIAVKDTDGCYKIVGRNKNTINAGGVNIYPEQVTEMINTHPQVLESICLGIPDDNFGEKMVAGVSLLNNEPLNKTDLISFLRPILVQNQIPKDFFFFPELPKGLAGKIRSKEVLQLI